MAENYIESIIIRQDNVPDVQEPSFVDEQVDAEFEFEGILKLTQIIKNVTNAEHNSHDYVFKIVEITKLKEED